MSKPNKSIQLKSYQKKVRDYTVQQLCTWNNGLMLWHYMGTGKTLTALTIAENIPGPKTIVCAKYLKYVWKTEILKWNVNKNYKIYSYEEYLTAPTQVDDTVVILDEIQNVVDSPRTLLRFSRALYRIALSGTPINTMVQFPMIMAALRPGEMTPSEFVQKFVKLNPINYAIRLISQASIIPLQFTSMLGIFVSSWIVYFSSVPFMAAVCILTKLFGTDNATNNGSWKTKEIAKHYSNSISFVSDQKIAKEVSNGIYALDDSKKEDEEHTYPSLYINKVKVPYSSNAIRISNEWARGKLSKEDAYILNASGSEFDDVELFNFLNPKNVLHRDNILRQGLALGMYHATSPARSEKGQVVLKMVKAILKRNESVMVFTSISGKCGVNGLTEIFVANDIDHVLIDSRKDAAFNQASNEKFNSGKTRVLICYLVAEGFSLKGCNNVIVLEPIYNNIAKFQQVCARPRRIDSHAHLPVNKRYVVVNILMSTYPRPKRIRDAMLGSIDAIERKIGGFTSIKDLHLIYQEANIRNSFGRRQSYFHNNGPGNMITALQYLFDKLKNLTSLREDALTKTVEDSFREIFSNEKVLLGNVNIGTLYLGHVIKLCLNLVRFAIAPRYHYEKLRRSTTAILDYKASSKVQFAVGEANEAVYSEVSPEEIAMSQLTVQISQFDKLILELKRNNVQTLDFGWADQCDVCEPWPEGDAKSCIVRKYPYVRAAWRAGKKSSK